MTNKDLEHKLERLADAIEKLAKPIPAIPAIPAIPQIPAIPPIISNIDDTRLTRVEVKIDAIQDSITELKSQNAQSPSRAEHLDVLKVQVDHEARIRIVETAITKMTQWGTIALILVGIGEFVISHFWK